MNNEHDDVIKWKHFPRYWPFVRGIYRSAVNSPHKGLWRGALMFILICARINVWVNNREAGDLRRYRAHYDVIVMSKIGCLPRQRDIWYKIRADSRFAPSQWETSLQSNTVSHWLDANRESALKRQPNQMQLGMSGPYRSKFTVINPKH